MSQQAELQVLRIENQEGHGIFISGFAQCYVPELMQRHMNFNTPAEDGLKMGHEWFCAYKTIEQIQQWIMPDEFKIINAHMYRVYLMTVTEYQIGDHQVIFTLDGVISKKDVTELFV